MDTLLKSAVLASTLTQNPYHIISICGESDMKHAKSETLFEIPEDDPNYPIIEKLGFEYLWVYTYADKESMEKDLDHLINQMDLLEGGDDQYFDYSPDELNMVLYGATLLDKQRKYKPLILQKLQQYQEGFDEEEHIELHDHYIYLLNNPGDLYKEQEDQINQIKSMVSLINSKSKWQQN